MADRRTDSDFDLSLARMKVSSRFCQRTRVITRKSSGIAIAIKIKIKKNYSMDACG
jgi:hypothetical protein